MTTHDARGSAAGYLYQCERALVELLRRSADAQVTLFLEAADDIEIDTDGHPEVALQVKHHLGGGPDLSDMSVDLWRTIGVWIDLLDEVQRGGVAVLTLVSTAHLSEGSGVAALASPGRDPERARSLLETAARASENAQTEATRRRFLGLPEEDRDRLINAIRVLPDEPGLEDLDGELRALLSLHLMVSEEKQAAFLEGLKGWWYGQCVTMLTHHGAGIGVPDLAVFLQQLRDSFHPENLPTSFYLPNPTDAELRDYTASVFVEQLRWIAYTNEQLGDSIRDYHRAFTQRSKWSRQGLLYPGELDLYERRLVDQWRRVFHDVVGELAADAAEADRERVGRRLLQQLRDSTSVRLRDRYTEVFMTHGSLHQLANLGEVGWHPDFKARLEALLSGAA